jgi:hypothetical protein
MNGIDETLLVIGQKKTATLGVVAVSEREHTG